MYVDGLSTLILISTVSRGDISMDASRLLLMHLDGGSQKI